MILRSNGRTKHEARTAKDCRRRLPGTQDGSGHLCRRLPWLRQRWLSRAANLDSIQNRLWFTRRHGNCPHPTLQAAWTAHGAETFAMEIIERLDEETLSYVRDRVLKDRLAHWCSAFGAEAI